MGRIVTIDMETWPASDPMEVFGSDASLDQSEEGYLKTALSGDFGRG